MSIKDEIEKLKHTKIKAFYSTAIHKKFPHLTLEEVERQLNELVSIKKIDKHYELLCTACYRTLDTQKDKNQFKEEYDCVYCGEELEDKEEFYLKEKFLL